MNGLVSAPFEPVTAGQISVGESSCDPASRLFADGAPSDLYCLAFPKRALWIEQEHHPAFVADPTRMTLYNPDQPFRRRAIDPAGGHAEWITFSPRLAREVAGRFDLHAAGATSTVIFASPYTSAPAHIHLAHRWLREYVRSQPSPDLLLVEETGTTLLSQTIAVLHRHLPRRSGERRHVTPRHVSLAEDTCAYLNRNYHENQSLTAIAAAMGTSVFHLCRIFRRITGSTVHAYRTQLRLRRALASLRDGDVDADLLTLALDLGYSGHSHFTASFRREFGVIPSEARNRLKNITHQRAY